MGSHRQIQSQSLQTRPSMSRGIVIDHTPDGTPELPDHGCWAAPSCIACPWARCVLELSGAEARKLGDALRVLQLFARADPMPG